MSHSYNQRYLNVLHGIRAKELEAILGAVDKRHLSQVLELGCGDGFQSAILKPHCQFLLSMDYRRDALPRKFSKELAFVACEVEALPVKSSSFSMIFSSNLLEHVEGIEKALAEMKTALLPGGIMIHAVPNITWKVIQLLLFYPFLVFLKVWSWVETRSGQKLDGGQETTIRFESNVKRDSPNQSLLKRFVVKLVPPIHGLSRSHIEEIYRFSDCYWRQVFKRNGLEITARIEMPFYSPYGFGLARLRTLCERFGLSSSNCYILAVECDVSPENDGRLELEYDGGFGGPVRKERTHEAVNVLGGTDRVRDPTGRRRHAGR
jgi:ubiquinone/menaquinone biosynthesis C-methylase UbiE